MSVQLFQGDCLDLIKDIPDESVDLVVTDCPYHIVQGGCTNDAVKIGRYTNSNNNIEMTKKGKLFEYNDIDFSEWLPDIYRVLKPNTHCYIMINPRNIKELQQKAENAGFAFQNILIWDKGNCTPNRYYLNSYEMILMLRKGKARNINNMGTKNILRVPNLIKSKVHPTEKPVELMRVMIENSSQVGDTVLDCFMGSGSTGVAAHNTNRNFIGIELDKNYFQIAKDRIKG